MIERSLRIDSQRLKRHLPHFLHVDIRNGELWIQHDGPEDGIASQLVAAGIPREHIVLAFKAPEARPLTDYAVA